MFLLLGAAQFALAADCCRTGKTPDPPGEIQPGSPDSPGMQYGTILLMAVPYGLFIAFTALWVVRRRNRPADAEGSVPQSA